MKTLTKTNVSTKTAIAVTVGVAVIAGAVAFIATGARTTLYQDVYMQCHDGTEQTTPMGDCRTIPEWNRYAQDFCSTSASSTFTGKTGINTLSKRQKCSVVSGSGSDGKGEKVTPKKRTKRSWKRFFKRNKK